MYRLVFLSGPQKGRRLAVREGNLVIGSGPDAHLRFADPAVLGRHAVMEQRGEGIVITSASALAEVKVNGAPTSERLLAHGDEVQFGQQAILFQRVEARSLFQKRRVTQFHRLTLVAVTAVLVVQLLIVAGLIVYWRLDPIALYTEPFGDAEQEEPTPVAPPTQDRADPPAVFRLLPEYVVVPVYENDPPVQVRPR